uniref:Ubiquitin-like-conjugating enzyme ATG10 n=1 Tax=Eptatretus burgeri TaxID=7764 RepID=A0A8C4WYN3_EPTBU
MCVKFHNLLVFFDVPQNNSVECGYLCIVVSCVHGLNSMLGMKDAPGGGYLRKVELVNLPSIGTESTDLYLQCETSFEVEDDSACTFTSEKGLAARFEYHVVYSPSYAVPVLYLNAHTLDGRRLSLDSILSRASLTLRVGLYGAGASRVSGAESQDGDEDDGLAECAVRWDGLTQQEHPLLGHPFYVLHPCRTAQLLQPIVSLARAERRQLNYLFCFPFVILGWWEKSSIGNVHTSELSLLSGYS